MKNRIPSLAICVSVLLGWLGLGCSLSTVEIPAETGPSTHQHGRAVDPPDLGFPLFTAWIHPDERKPIQALDIKYTNQDGQSGRLHDLLKQPLLITFFYTRCENNYKCSAGISRLASLQRRLIAAGVDRQIGILAITYEPRFDTPERLKRYGHNRGLRFNDYAMAIQLDPDRHPELVQDLEIPVNYNADWVNTHGVELNLIDAKGRLARKYHTVLWENDQVVDDVNRLLMEH